MNECKKRGDPGSAVGVMSKATRGEQIAGRQAKP
jgi:hypothetical protein